MFFPTVPSCSECGALSWSQHKCNEATMIEFQTKRFCEEFWVWMGSNQGLFEAFYAERRRRG